MSKSQKIWLWVPASVFFLPEILWSPLGNFLYSFFMPTVGGSSQILRNNFLLDSRFESLYLIIVLIQLVGIILFTINWVRFKKYFKTPLIYFSVLVLSIFLVLTNLTVIYLWYAISTIDFL